MLEAHSHAQTNGKEVRKVGGGLRYMLLSGPSVGFGEYGFMYSLYFGIRKKPGTGTRVSIVESIKQVHNGQSAA